MTINHSPLGLVYVSVSVAAFIACVVVFVFMLLRYRWNVVDGASAYDRDASRLRVFVQGFVTLGQVPFAVLAYLVLTTPTPHAAGPGLVNSVEFRRGLVVASQAAVGIASTIWIVGRVRLGRREREGGK